MPPYETGEPCEPRPAVEPVLACEAGGDAPWEEDAASADDPGGPRERHDAFNQAKRAQFLRALVKTGCIAEACRRTDIAPRTVYNHQRSDAQFLAYCTTAQRMAATPLEIAAWSRAVDGVEETVVVGGRATTRTRYSEHLLRLLLQASDPKRFGRNPGFTRKRIQAAERKAIEKEARRDQKEKDWAEFRAIVDQAVEARQARLDAAARAASAASDAGAEAGTGQGAPTAHADGNAP